jgi:uncharacterized protein YjhX (UPF0386 family)
VTSRTARTGQRTNEKLAQICGGRVSVEQSNLRRVTSREHARRGIWPILQLFDCLLNCFPRISTDILAAI